MKVFRQKWLARIMFVLFLVGPGVAMVPDGLRSNEIVAQDFSLDKLENEVEGASDTIKSIVKTVLVIVALIAGVFVVYNIMTNHPNAKNYGIGYVVGLIVIAIIWALFL